MANGTNSRRAPPFPGTRAKSAALVREQFVKAHEYREKLAEAAADPKKPPARDLGLEALVEVLDGKRIVHFHTHRHDDILTVLRLAEEFGFRVVLHHVSDGWKVAPQIAASRQVSAARSSSSTPRAASWRPRTSRSDNGAALEKAGVAVGFHTDDGITDSRFFLRSAALASAPACRARRRSKAVTLAGARMLELASRVGSLEPGKDADFVVLSGDPFSVYTHVGDLGRRREGLRPRRRRRTASTPSAAGASHDSQSHLARARRGRGGDADDSPGPTALSRSPLRAAPRRPAPPAQLAVRGETIHTMAGAPIRDGVVLVAGRQDRERRPRVDVPIPAGYRTLRAKVVTPGLVDAHSVVGLSGVAQPAPRPGQLEKSAPMQPELRAIDAYNAAGPARRLAPRLRRDDDPHRPRAGRRSSPARRWS